ncbi:MAG: hypothetical protein GY852_07220, partial [bacterium]|nr:hypothetical protein [bacterium]
MLWRHWEKPANRVFAVFLVSMSLWGVMACGMRISQEAGYTVWWERISTIFIASTLVFFYHFTLRYSRSKAPPRLLSIAYMYLLGVLVLAPSSLIIQGVTERFYGNAPEMGVLYPLFFIPGYVLVATGIYELNNARKEATSYAERNRFLYFMIGGSVVVVGGITGLLAALGLNVFPGTAFSNILLILMGSIAIIRQRLFDIQLSSYRAIPYAFMFIILSA